MNQVAVKKTQIAYGKEWITLDGMDWGFVGDKTLKLYRKTEIVNGKEVPVGAIYMVKGKGTRSRTLQASLDIFRAHNETILV